MAHPVIDPLTAQIAATVTVIDGATVLVAGIADRVAAAVAEALANGATAEQLAPLTALSEGLKTETQQLADAILANTPTPLPPAGAKKSP